MGNQDDEQDEIPVYMFRGFLESGKTTFIMNTLQDPYFYMVRSLYL